MEQKALAGSDYLVHVGVSLIHFRRYEGRVSAILEEAIQTFTSCMRFAVERDIRLLDNP